MIILVTTPSLLFLSHHPVVFSSYSMDLKEEKKKHSACGKKKIATLLGPQ